jgi:hypothetical protein
MSACRRAAAQVRPAAPTGGSCRAGARRPGADDDAAIRTSAKSGGTRSRWTSFSTTWPRMSGGCAHGSPRRRPMIRCPAAPHRRPIRRCLGVSADMEHATPLFEPGVAHVCHRAVRRVHEPAGKGQRWPRGNAGCQAPARLVPNAIGHSRCCLRRPPPGQRDPAGLS